MDIIKVKRGHALVGIEITDCNFKTLRCAVKAMQRYIGEGYNFDEFTPGEYFGGNYIHRNGNDLSVRYVDDQDINSTIIFDTTTDIDGNIIYMWALVSSESVPLHTQMMASNTKFTV